MLKRLHFEITCMAFLKKSNDHTLLLPMFFWVLTAQNYINKPQPFRQVTKQAQNFFLFSEGCTWLQSHFSTELQKATFKTLSFGLQLKPIMHLSGGGFHDIKGAYKNLQNGINSKRQFDVFWTVHYCDNWRIKKELDATYYFIVLLKGSTCFGHYYAHPTYSKPRYVQFQIHNTN